MFQKNAMGKFFKKVPTQIEGSWLTGAPARIHIKKNRGCKGGSQAVSPQIGKKEDEKPHIQRFR